MAVIACYEFLSENRTSLSYVHMQLTNQTALILGPVHVCGVSLVLCHPQAEDSPSTNTLSVKVSTIKAPFFGLWLDFEAESACEYDINQLQLN